MRNGDVPDLKEAPPHRGMKAELPINNHTHPQYAVRVIVIQGEGYKCEDPAYRAVHRVPRNLPVSYQLTGWEECRGYKIKLQSL
jgi:hypothetical protein